MKSLLVWLLMAGVAVAEVSFTAKPVAKKDGDGCRIAFTVSAPTDVEVAILDAGGAVVRHLAAGQLGPNAPEPFQKNALDQAIAWDGRDDAGKQVSVGATVATPLNAAPSTPGPLAVRVRIGSAPALDRIAGWDGATLGSSVAGMVVGKGGELFVLDSDRGWGRAGMRVFDKDGKYLRTIAPYAANTPTNRTASTFALEIDGEHFPTVFNAHCGNLLPLFAGMKNQTMAWHPQGYLVLASAVGNIAEHGPPRHLLAMHPQGGAPEGVKFVGPQFRAPIGFMGGAGERDVNFYDHLAVSPDGEYVYLTTYKLFDKNQRHAVFRMKWSDVTMGPAFLGKDGEPGADDDHLSEPQGVATDPAGQIYVCDRGNDRVVIFSADGKRIGKFAVAFPYQVAVHPKTREIYIVSRKRPAAPREQIPPVVIRKFAPWSAEPGKGDPAEMAKIEAVGDTIALDPETSPTRLWIHTGKGLAQLLDKGASFELGAVITNSKGLAFPMFIAADPARNRVLVREKSGGLFALDLASDTIKPLGIKGTDPALDREGNIYVMDGYGANSLSRYTPDGKPLPFAATGANRLNTGVYRGYGPDMGLRGHCVAPNGDIYVIRSNNSSAIGLGGGVGGVVDVFGPDGKPKKTPLINGLGYGDCGLGVDAAGNVYLGVNAKPLDKPFPEPFMGKVSAEPYVWWRKGKRAEPWWFMYYNPYLYHWGSVMKFGPAGGTFYGNTIAQAKGQPPAILPLAEAPADAVKLRTAYLGQEIAIAGMQWRYAGYGPVSASNLNWGDPSCVCMTARLAADEYGRVYAPNPFRFSVEMLDTAGNQISRIGRYGNADDSMRNAERGMRSGQPEDSALRTPNPAICFAWPAFVSAAGGKVYVSDPDSRRIVVVKFNYAAAETCEVK
jgi:DNA-binding beta-propeller fold protein YncE